MEAIKTSGGIQKRNKWAAFDVVNVFLLMAFSVVALYPFYNVYVYAFNDGLDSLKGALYLWPRKFTLGNFMVAFSQEGILSAFNVSLLRTLAGTVLTLACTSSLAFVMSKRNLPGYKAFSAFFFITFLFYGGLIPYFLTIKEIGLYNNFWVLVIPGIYSYWNMIIFRSFFGTIPDSIEESAKLDGATYFRIFVNFIVPLSKPVFAAIALFTAVNHWNDWYAGVFYIKDQALVPLQTLLQNLMTEANMVQKLMEMSGGALRQSEFKNITPYAIRLAIVVITVTPIILVYPFLQKYIIKGIMIGAIKG